MTRLFALGVLAVVTLSACGSRAPAPTGPTREPERTAGSGSADAGSGIIGGGTGSAAPAADDRVTEADCHAAIDHTIDIDMRERPADQQLAADQLAEVRAHFRASYLARCREQERVVLACIMAASTRSALAACDR